MVSGQLPKTFETRVSSCGFWLLVVSIIFSFTMSDGPSTVASQSIESSIIVPIVRRLEQNPRYGDNGIVAESEVSTIGRHEKDAHAKRLMANGNASIRSRLRLPFKHQSNNRLPKWC
jgi:hypothetical protein